MPVDPRTPVLIGYGQVNHRDEIDPETRSVEPVDLMVAAARQAADARALEAVDSIRVVNVLSATYRDAGLLVHEAGYRCVAAGAGNMFPHTAHVESMAVFERG